MIPKVIHYCWFGRNPLTDDVKEYMESWKKNCPDYLIKRWDEDSFDIGSCNYTKEAYEKRKWAFVTDYVRLYALVKEGGVYMDTDVEMLRPLDPFLKHKAFSGFQDEKSIPTGIMACEPDFPFFKVLLDDYYGRHFINPDGTCNTTTNVSYITKSCLERGLKLNNTYQEINDFALYPSDVFCAKSPTDGKLFVNENTVTIHHFAGSWIEKSVKERIGRRNLMTSKYGKVGLLLYYATNWPHKLKENIKRRKYNA